MTVRQVGQGRNTYESVREGREFRQIKRRFRAVVVPLVVGFLAWYFCYVALAAFAPDRMAVKVFGAVNVGIVLGLLQFVSTFAVTTFYAVWARRSLDPLTDRLRDRIVEAGAR